LFIGMVHLRRSLRRHPREGSHPIGMGDLAARALDDTSNIGVQIFGIGRTRNNASHG
jgi:hypothetical protein